MQYSNLLAKKAWEDKRKFLLRKLKKQPSPKCAFCGKGIFEKRFDIHHKFYVHGFAPWEYPFWVFSFLHSDCHKRFHAANKVNAYEKSYFKTNLRALKRKYGVKICL